MDPVVITSPDELLSALPHVLGFTAQESIITVPFRAGGLVARVDIPKSPEERRQAIGSLRSAYARNAGPGTMVAIVCVTEDRQAAEKSSRALATALEEVGIGAPLRLWAPADRWVELNSGRSGLRTPATASRIAAEAAYTGFTPPAPTRQALAESLVGDHGPVAAVLERARETAEANGPGTEHLWSVGRLAQFHGDGVRLTDPQAARMLVALEHKPTRDALWEDMSRNNAVTHVALWTDLTRRAPDEIRTPPATMLAFSSWLNGEGAKAWCALDQIPPDTPPYTMASIVATALHNATPPVAWEESKTTLDRSEAFVPTRPSQVRDLPTGLQARAPRPPAP